MSLQMAIIFRSKSKKETEECRDLMLGNSVMTMSTISFGNREKNEKDGI